MTTMMTTMMTTARDDDSEDDDEDDEDNDSDDEDLGTAALLGPGKLYVTLLRSSFLRGVLSIDKPWTMQIY